MKFKSHKKSIVETFVPINSVICDHCKKEVSDHGEILIGGGHFGGWYNLNRTIKGTYIDELRKPSNWDFCSEKCLQEFVQSLKID